jgi:starvation-inducible DNA-binding protein
VWARDGYAIAAAYRAHSQHVLAGAARGAHRSARCGARRREEENVMAYKSPSPLPEKDREQIAASLNARLADGLDLHSQIKVAHWNVKGPQFAALHPLFETFAVGLAAHNDALAERAVTLGAQVRGSARYVSRASSLPEYPADATQGLVHARLLAERFEQYVAGLRETRKLATGLGDEDTVDLVNAAVQEFEKHAWFLRASLVE